MCNKGVWLVRDSCGCVIKGCGLLGIVVGV